MVTGKVALEDEVENAVAIADAIALKCNKGLTFVAIKNIKGRIKSR